jgi:hypothetical protein
MKTRTIAVVVLVASALAAAGCVAVRRNTLEDRRAYARLAKESALVELEKAVSGARVRVAGAAGWAAFGMGGEGAFDAKRGEGFGVAHDNVSGAETFMTMRTSEDEACSVVLVFEDHERFRAFVAVGGELETAPPVGVDVHLLIKGVPAPTSELAGTRFEPDTELGSTK